MTQEAKAYDAWFRVKVEAAMADIRPKIPHDQAMSKLRELMMAKKSKRA